MTLEQINKIIEDYESLLQLIRVKVKILLEYDLQKYYGINHADRVSIEYEKAYLTTWDYFDSWNFPLEWLALDNESLKETVLLAKEKRLKEEQLFKLKEQEAKDFKELQEFEKLKKKFNYDC